jgi:hypothetical protein
MQCSSHADDSFEDGHAPGSEPAEVPAAAAAGGQAAGAPGGVDAREAAALIDAAAVLPSRASVLVTDMIDHRWRRSLLPLAAQLMCVPF